MLDFERGLYVSIVELPTGPRPFPLQSGFSAGLAYRVLGMFNPAESGECWLMLSNDTEQIWHISQRHVRTHRIDSASTRFREALSADTTP